MADAVDSGAWVQPWHGVVVPADRAGEPLTRAAAALLRTGPHSALSGPTAVAMHGCGPADEVLHVTVPYGHELRCPPDLSIHHGWLRDCDVVELDGLRVHALDMAIAELLCRGPQREALDCLERAMNRLGERAEQFRAVVRERLDRRRDRRGTRQAAALLQLAWTTPRLAMAGAR